MNRNGGAAEANIPLDQYAFYVQDDWRLTDRLTLNLGLRYDLIDGIQIDQSKNPNYVKVQAAGAAGLLNGIRGMENFGKEPQEDTNNWQPRIGFAYDLRGNGKDVIRGGWGVYQDVGYTNSNVLFPAIDATGIGSGVVFDVDVPAGIRNADGSFYRVGQPITNIASQNQANPNSLPLIGQFLDPRLQMPYTRQASFGWSHQFWAAPCSASTSSATTPAISTCGRASTPARSTSPTAPRRLTFLDLQPDAAGTRPAISDGKGLYHGAHSSLRRRLTNGLDFTANYTLAEAKSTVGTAGDELNANNLQDADAPLRGRPGVYGPTNRTDARHTGTIAAVWQAPWGINVSPIFLFRSPLPVPITEGLDTQQQRRAQRHAG